MATSGARLRRTARRWPAPAHQRLGPCPRGEIVPAMADLVEQPRGVGVVSFGPLVGQRVERLQFPTGVLPANRVFQRGDAGFHQYLHRLLPRGDVPLAIARGARATCTSRWTRTSCGRRRPRRGKQRQPEQLAAEFVPRVGWPGGGGPAASGKSCSTSVRSHGSGTWSGGNRAAYSSARRAGGVSKASIGPSTAYSRRW